jgi:hypothetical protein
MSVKHKSFPLSAFQKVTLEQRPKSHLSFFSLSRRSKCLKFSTIQQKVARKLSYFALEAEETYRYERKSGPTTMHHAGAKAPNLARYRMEFKIDMVGLMSTYVL